MILRRGSRHFLISIHAPREGGDRDLADDMYLVNISIHAPREGGDFDYAWKIACCLYFNPRPPRGGRPVRYLVHLDHPAISIHAPREGGDILHANSGYRCIISIHAPREGGDFMFLRRGPVTYDFNPRPPRGGRQHTLIFVFQQIKISIHAPREGGDSKDAQFYL